VETQWGRTAREADGPPLSSLTTYISVPVAIADGVRYAMAGRRSKGAVSNSGIGQEVEDEYA
jgi:hypothetical protein